MTNLSLLKRIVPFFLSAAPLGVLSAGCGSTDVPFGAQSRAVQPIVPTPGVGVEGGRTVTPGASCEFGGFSWQANSFALYPDEQTCLGDQWVRYDEGLRLWVGLTTCSANETRIYLSATAEGPFAAAADTAGHGQDHCELVNAAFTLTNEDDITSGGCADCATGPNLPLEGLPAFARANLGEPFAFVENTPEWSHQVSRLSCGVQLACGATTPPPPPGTSGLPQTADGGNADGVHACGEGRYDHYEEVSSTGPALHVVSVYTPTESGTVTVDVNRPGPSILFLSAYEATQWQINVAPGSTVERIVLSGYYAQTVAAPAEVPVESHSFDGGDGVYLGTGYQWPSVGTAEVVANAEAATGRTLTSFRGCYEGASFQIDAPGKIRPPHPTTNKAEPTLPKGCEAIADESTYCIGLDGGSVAAIGLDSGTVCAGKTGVATNGTVSSLGWVGDYVYTCEYERGLVRTSIVDGSVDVAPINCDSATSQAGGILVSNFFANETSPELSRFGDFNAAALGQPQASFASAAFASRIATNGDQVYAAWHSTSTIETAPLASGEQVSSISLEGFDNWIWAMDVLDDGRLLVNSGYFSDAPGFLVFDAVTGESQGVLPVGDGKTPLQLQGLDCVSKGSRR